MAVKEYKAMNVEPLRHSPEQRTSRCPGGADKNCGRARPITTMIEKGLSLMAGQPESHKLRATGSKGKLRQRH
jgi:hypothetical protein